MASLVCYHAAGINTRSVVGLRLVPFPCKQLTKARDDDTAESNKSGSKRPVKRALAFAVALAPCSQRTRQLPAMLQDASEDVNRFVTMSLGSQGGCTIGNAQSEGRRANLNIVSNVNDVSDIRGTKPLMKAYQYTNRPKLWNDTSDIKGSVPMTLHPKNPNKIIGRNLNNDDIEYSKPQMYTFKTKRCTNPGQPKYVIPGHSENFPEANGRKQTHQSNQTDDIDGAKPRIPLASRYAMRDNYNVNDIEGSTTTWKPRHQRRNEWAPRNTNYDCKDINDKRVFSNRVSDPLNPCHRIHGRVLGQDPKSKPKECPKERDGGMMPVLSLLTQDIEGAVPGWKPKHVNGGIPEEHRRHFRNINYVGDIKGAGADSLVRNMPNYGRHVDPLEPQYTDLDGGNLLPSARQNADQEPASENYENTNAVPRLSVPSAANSNSRPPTTQAWGAADVSDEQRQDQEQDNMIRGLQQQKEHEQDLIIANLQAQLEDMRVEMTSARGSSRGSARGSSRAGSRAGMSSRGSTTSRGSNRRSSRGSNAGDVEQYSARGGAHAVDRMVLKSSNGQPRVPMTPAERRADQELASDIESVRGL